MAAPPPPPPAGCAACRKALESFSARQLRLMFLLQPWHKGMVYGEQSCNEMRSRESQIKNFFQNVDAAMRSVNVNATEQRWQVGEAAGRALRLMYA
jgi:cysteinyl-tRNA synthetase